MPNLVVNGVTYPYPDSGQEPGWGENATDWAEAVTDALGTLLAPGDLVNIAANIGNNITTPTDLVGCLFNSAQTKAANVTYRVVRSVTGTTISETGTLLIHFDPVNGWIMARSYMGGDAGLNFSITAGGQVRYTSSNLTGVGYQGTIKFNAKTLP